MAALLGNISLIIPKNKKKVRGIFLMIQPDESSKRVTSLWGHFSDGFFFLVFFMLFLLWMNFYYTISENFESKLKVATCSVFGIVLCMVPLYFIVELVLLAMFEVDLQEYNIWLAAVVSIMEILLIIGCAFIGILFFLVMRKDRELKILDKEQKRRIMKVSLVVAFCTISFGCRSIVSLVSVSQNNDLFAAGNFFNSWYEIILYFSSFDIIPCILILYLLGNLPTWKMKDAEDPDRTSLLIYDRHELAIQ